MKLLTLKSSIAAERNESREKAGAVGGIMHIIYTIQEIENGWILFYPTAKAPDKHDVEQRFFNNLAAVLNFLKKDGFVKRSLYLK